MHSHPQPSLRAGSAWTDVTQDIQNAFCGSWGCLQLPIHSRNTKFLSCFILLDRHSGASAEVQKEEEKKFKEVGEAFTILSDPKKKARYDSGQDLEEDGLNMGGKFLWYPPFCNNPTNWLWSVGVFEWQVLLKAADNQGCMVDAVLD